MSNVCSQCVVRVFLFLILKWKMRASRLAGTRDAGIPRSTLGLLLSEPTLSGRPLFIQTNKLSTTVGPLLRLCCYSPSSSPSALPIPVSTSCSSSLLLLLLLPVDTLSSLSFEVRAQNSQSKDICFRFSSLLGFFVCIVFVASLAADIFFKSRKRRLLGDNLN